MDRSTGRVGDRDALCLDPSEAPPSPAAEQPAKAIDAPTAIAAPSRESCMRGASWRLVVRVEAFMTTTF
jgi:hypothetical protein